MIKEHVLSSLYLSKRRSMSEIAKLLGKSERQVDYWMRKYGIEKRKISDAVYIKHNNKGDPFVIPPFINKLNLTKTPSFQLGLFLGLYWGEGNKKNPYAIRLGNSDPKLILRFVDILTSIFKINVDKLKFGLQLFSDINKEEALIFWSKHLGVSKGRFYKPIVTISGKVGNYKNKSKYGVVTVYFNNIKFRNFVFEKILEL